ncbi:hypothetical protein B484DRAFT_395112 [Ochromonadaceae sp. CCMP2298]|nr:hypothetical protein B484DRAFT_395112 [Ochromonadaceae sp. CCMP2298]
MGNGLPSRSDIPLKYRTELETWGINADSWGTVSGYESLYDNELAMGQSKEEAAQTVRDKHTEDMGFEDSTNEPDTEEDFKSCKGVEAPVATLANAPGPRRIKDPSKKQLVDLGCIPDVYAENILPRLHEYYAEHGWEVHSFDAMHGPYPSDPLSTELYPLERDMESRPEQHAFKDALQFVAQNDVDCILVGNSAWR